MAEAAAGSAAGWTGPRRRGAFSDRMVGLVQDGQERSDNPVTGGSVVAQVPEAGISFRHLSLDILVFLALFSHTHPLFLTDLDEFQTSRMLARQSP